MQVHVARSAEEWNKLAARVVAGVIKEEASPVLGLATGNTPIGMYRELVNMYRAGELDFSRVRTFNLDEYLGIPPEHPASFISFMKQHLFDHVNLDPARTHIPRSNPESPEEEAARYRALFLQYGPCHLQVLGIGRNGHIGFNEPGTPFTSVTSVVELTESTKRANAPAFGGDPAKVPDRAITMGISEIMSAKKILLLATGAAKAQILREALEGPVTEAVPASILQRHPDVIVICDEEAASELRHTSVH